MPSIRGSRKLYNVDTEEDNMSTEEMKYLLDTIVEENPKNNYINDSHVGRESVHWNGQQGSFHAPSGYSQGYAQQQPMQFQPSNIPQGMQPFQPSNMPHGMQQFQQYPQSIPQTYSQQGIYGQQQQYMNYNNNIPSYSEINPFAPEQYENRQDNLTNLLNQSHATSVNPYDLQESVDNSQYINNNLLRNNKYTTENNMPESYNDEVQPESYNQNKYKLSSIGEDEYIYSELNKQNIEPISPLELANMLK
jgi:hypothetical protein